MDGSYDRVTRWLAVDLNELRQRLEAWDTNEDRRKTMLKLYPGLFFLVAMSQGEDISKVMEEAEDLHKDPETMGLWFQWWLVPHFEMLIQQGEIKRGKEEMENDHGVKIEYDGYVNKSGKHHGVGTLIYPSGDQWE